MVCYSVTICSYWTIFVYLFHGSDFVSAAIHWPSPDSLILEVPFNSESLLQDRVCKLQPFYSGAARLVADSPGPFGANSSAMTVQASGSWIADYRYIPLKTGFTISMFFLTAADHAAGILQVFFNDIYNSTIAVSTGNKGSIDLRSVFMQTTGSNWHAPDYFSKNEWNWFAFTYDDINKVYVQYIDESYANQTIVTFGIDKPIRIVVGQATPLSGNNLSMKATDAVACLAVYDKALDEKQLIKIREACQVKPPQKSKGACPRPTVMTTSTTARSPPLETPKLRKQNSTSQAFSAYLSGPSCSVVFLAVVSVTLKMGN